MLKTELNQAVVKISDLMPQVEHEQVEFSVTLMITQHCFMTSFVSLRELYVWSQFLFRTERGRM